MYTEDQVSRTLSAIGIEVYQELAEDYLVFCPYHFNTRTAAAEVSKTSGVFYCFSCNVSASLPKLVMFVTKRSFFEALRVIDSKSSGGDIRDQIAVAMVSTEPEPFDQKLLDRLHDDALSSDRARRYLDDRNILAGMETYKLGYSKNADMITVPVHSQHGMPLGFVARSIEGKVFKNSTGLKKSRTLYNLNRTKTEGQVIVVESSFDAIRLGINNIPAVATLGSGVSKYQLELLKNTFLRALIAPDSDEAGKKMTEKLKEKLGDSLTVIPLPPEVKDVGDLSEKQIKKLSEFISNPLAGMLQ